MVLVCVVFVCAVFADALAVALFLGVFLRRGLTIGYVFAPSRFAVFGAAPRILALAFLPLAASA